MTTAEKLQKIDEGVEETIALNAELEQTLYGTDVDKTLDENVEQTESDFQAIKDKIVEHGVEVADGTRTAEYASKVDDVFGAGKKAEYDAFWDRLQNNGKQTNYDYAFRGWMWGPNNFFPKYDIRPTSAEQMFYAWSDTVGSDDASIRISLKKRLEECGVVLDTSQCTMLRGAFSYMHVTEIPTIDCTGLVADSYNSYNLFSYDYYLETIEKIITNERITYNGWFTECSALRNVIFEGTIANAINFAYCRALSKDSIYNIVNHLSSTASGKTIHFSNGAVRPAFETSSGANDGNSSPEWLALIGTKTNWTISLV